MATDTLGTMRLVPMVRDPCTAGSASKPQVHAHHVSKPRMPDELLGSGAILSPAWAAAAATGAAGTTFAMMRRSVWRQARMKFRTAMKAGRDRGTDVLDRPVTKQRVASETEVAAEPAEERTLMVVLVALAYVIWQMDKVNMSVAILPMMAEYGWRPSEEGIIQSAIFWGYAATQIIGGFLSTKYGGKRVLLGAVTLWSTATLLAPIAAGVSTEVFVASRVLVGIGEGLAPAAGTRIVATWMPKEERSRAISALGSGKFLGGVAGLLLAPFVIEGYGWPVMFYSFGVLGLAWSALWAVLGKDKEEAVEASATEDTPVPWGEILSTPALWGVALAHFCNDWGAYALLTWTPQYLFQELGYNLKGSSALTVLPSILAVGVAAFAGTLADKMLADGTSLTQVRKMMQATGFILPGICLTSLGMLGTVEQGSILPIALLAGGISCSAFSLPGLYASHADLNPKYSGLVNGVSTTFGALAGLCSNAYAGYALESTGSWAQAIFLPSVAMYVIGLVGYVSLYDATPIDWDAAAAANNAAKRKEQ